MGRIYLLFIFLACSGIMNAQNTEPILGRTDSLHIGTVYTSDTIAVVDSVRWDDLVSGPLLARLPNDDPATFNEDSITVDFAASGTDIALFQFQLSHSTVQDTAYDLDLHVHWIQQDTGSVKWVANYSITNVGGGSSAFVNSTRNVSEFEYSSGNLHQISSVLLIPSETVGISSIVRVKLIRQGSDGSDTYTGVARVLSVDIHYPRDVNGGSKYIDGRY